MFCENVVEQTDRRWRRDARVVMYQLMWADNGRLRWQLFGAGPWRSAKWVQRGRRSVRRTAIQMARETDRERQYPEFTGVRHNSYLTPTQARRLAFMAGVAGDDGKPPPAWMAMDWIREDERNHPKIVDAGMAISRIEEQRDAAELAAENEWRDKYED